MKIYFTDIAARNALQARGEEIIISRYYIPHEAAVARVLEETFAGLSSRALRILAERPTSGGASRLMR